MKKMTVLIDFHGMCPYTIEVNGYEGFLVTRILLNICFCDERISIVG